MWLNLEAASSCGSFGREVGAPCMNALEEQHRTKRRGRHSGIGLDNAGVPRRSPRKLERSRL